MWTDDHKPEVPTSKWTADAPVSYTRTMFIPKFPYEGQTFVDVGLWDPSTGERVRMEGEGVDRAYRVASFGMKLQSDAPFLVFTEGWHQLEGSGPGSEATECAEGEVDHAAGAVQHHQADARQCIDCADADADHDKGEQSFHVQLDSC